MFKYSYNSLVYYGEEIAIGIKRVSECGYDAIELYGEPDNLDAGSVRKLCGQHNISVSSICSIYTAERDLASPDTSVRKNAVTYVKRVADLAAGVGCPLMIVAPTACTKLEGWKDPAEERKWALDSIHEGGEYANSIGVGLTIETWNRYETYFLNRFDQSLELMSEIDLPNIGVMGDTFHMNIEEGSIADAFRLAGKLLTHVHFADSNRAVPGKGHLDFVSILKALKEIDYQGYITFELLPAAADPFGTLKKGGGREFFDEYTKEAINYIKALENEL
ncbi:MAG: sugar phosphate isomerase/epimerase [Spirochaetes bacterium]|nr:sugar phosphate isomerase/epimerase [Spirochaetota bacterium]